MKRELKVLGILATVALFCIGTEARAQGLATVGGTLPQALTIPDGTASTCGVSTGPSLDINLHVGAGLPAIGAIQVTIDVAHTWYGDVILEVTHGSTTVTLMTSSLCTEETNLDGVYTFDDVAPTTLDAAVLAAGPTGTVPSGTYRGDNPLAAFLGLDPTGIWTFSFRDQVNADTGTVRGVSLSLPCSQAYFTVGQVFGSGTPLVINHQCGASSDLFLSAATPGNGNVPLGTFYGVDVTQGQLLEQITFGEPFWGLLSVLGQYTGYDTSLPPGTTLSCVGVHFDTTTLLPSFISLPFTLTVN